MQKISSLIIGKKRAVKVFIAFAASLFFFSCATESADDVRAIYDHSPMRFNSSGQDAEVTTPTRATILKNDFSVSCWKSFKETNQQIVMDNYKVQYSSGTTSGSTSAGTKDRWSYTDIDGQTEKYWDIASFPYEFRAVTPWFSESMVSISSNNLTISFASDNNISFKAQTFLENNYNCTSKRSEACLLAQVRRSEEGKEYKDEDLLVGKEINATTKANPVRDVHLPFHHLMSKVGFRIYIDDPQPDYHSYTVTLKDVEIKIEPIHPATEVITESNGYSCTNDNLFSGTFENNSTQPSFVLLKKPGEYSEDLRKCLNHSTAFDFNVKSYEDKDLQQIPQGPFKIKVSLTLIFNGTTKNINTYLSADNNAEGDNYSWEPNKYYLYYLRIPNLVAQPIILTTCEVTDWEEVKTSDIEVGL